MDAGLAEVRAAGLDGDEGIVPKAYVVRSAEAPALDTSSQGYFTGGERGVSDSEFRVIYPKINLGKAYYVGTLRDDEATAADNAEAN
jgi:hypothetical protein